MITHAQPYRGLCANFSEQFVLTDLERDQVMEAVLAHVAGRVPVIVTMTHFASHVCAERSRRAEAMGAAMVTIMPHHGATSGSVRRRSRPSFGVSRTRS
jgi:2-keto-3-deoxy-L-arabinonate dehydratase